MPPFVLLGLLLGSLYGTIFHLWRGKSLRDFLIYLVAGIIGFGAGQGLGMALGFNMWLVGPLHVVEATVMSWASLFLIQWLKI
ncbi:MAG: hypothetical protein KDI79_15735 [Anaerolineae bacterium]|nr:hypothetical protein [Anaerolineae bacterium]